MQLTNIARDVGEDARAGRLYLPLAWLREAGIDPEAWLARPAFSPALASVVAAAAGGRRRRLTGGPRPASPSCRPDCRPGIQAARLLYAEIGRELGARRDWIRWPAARSCRSAARHGCWRAHWRAYRCRGQPAAVPPLAAAHSWSRRCSRRRLPQSRAAATAMVEFRSPGREHHRAPRARRAPPRGGRGMRPR